MKQPSISLVELPATSFGRLGNPAVNNTFSFARYPARANPLLHAILLRERFRDVRSINPDFNNPRGELSLDDYARIIDSDWLLLSALSRTIDSTKELANLYKQANPDGKVVIGGHHATALPEEVLQWADIVVLREGDKTLPELIKNGDPNGIKGTAWKKGNEIIFEEPRPLLTQEEFDNLPIPYFEGNVRKRARSVPLNTARGCLYNCDFCSVRSFFGDEDNPYVGEPLDSNGCKRPYIRRSVESVIDELASYIDMPGRAVMITDDLFYDDKFGAHEHVESAKHLLEAIIRTKEDIRQLRKKKLIIQSRVTASRDKEFLDLFKRAGGTATCVGVESIIPETLKAMKKGQTVEEINHGLYEFGKAGIWRHIMMILGMHGETREDLRKTSEWANQHGDSYQGFSVVPLPGTQLAKEMAEKGRLLFPQNDPHYYLYDGHYVLVRPENMTSHELQQDIVAGTRSFYSWKNYRKNMFGKNYWPVRLRLVSYGSKSVDKFLADPQTVDHLKRLKAHHDLVKS